MTAQFASIDPNFLSYRWRPCRGLYETRFAALFGIRHGQVSEATEGLEYRPPSLPRSSPHRCNAVSRSGVHSRAIQAVLGWDQVAMVDRYAHFVNEMRKEAATKMGRDSKPRGCQHGCQTARTES